MKTGIYQIINLVNGKHYIGSVANGHGFPRRWGNHRGQLNNNRHPNPYLQSAWNKYGEENFQFEILEFCLPEDCISIEQRYLDAMDWTIAYNICRVAGNTLGTKRSEETKRRLSEASKGCQHWLGRKHSAESKLKMAIAKLGNIPWNKGLTGLSNPWQKGRVLTDETKQKISIARLGTPAWNRGIKGIHLSPASEFKPGAIPWNKGKTYKHRPKSV